MLTITGDDFSAPAHYAAEPTASMGTVFLPVSA